MEASVLVLGVGHLDRGDDAAGIIVARRLAALGCNAREAPGDGLALLAAWRGQGTVIIVDAVVSGAAPGTVHRVDATRDALPEDATPSSSHGWDLREAIEMGRVLGALPEALIVYGIEATSFATGAALSPAVALACEEVISTIAAELGCGTRPPPKPG